MALEYSMKTMSKEKTSRVTFDGRTIVNTRALIREPRVQEMLEKVAKVKVAQLVRKAESERRTHTTNGEDAI